MHSWMIATFMLKSTERIFNFRSESFFCPAGKERLAHRGRVYNSFPNKIKWGRFFIIVTYFALNSVNPMGRTPTSSPTSGPDPSSLGISEMSGSGNSTVNESALSVFLSLKFFEHSNYENKHISFKASLMPDRFSCRSFFLKKCPSNGRLRVISFHCTCLKDPRSGKGRSLYAQNSLTVSSPGFLTVFKGKSKGVLQKNVSPVSSMRLKLKCSSEEVFFSTSTVKSVIVAAPACA